MRAGTKRLFLATLFTALLAQSGFATEKPSESPPFRLTISTWIGYAPLLVAKEKGFFNDLNVDIRFIDDLGTRRATLLANQVDGWGSTVDNLAIDSTVGISAKTVMCIDESAGADGIIVRPGIDWQNLKGRKVAVEKQFPGHFLLLMLLKQHGLKPSDIETIDLGGDKMGKALAAGAVDAAVTWEPWISRAPDLAHSKKLFTTSEQPGLIIDTLAIRSDVLDSRPRDARTLVEGTLRAIDWITRNSEEADTLIGSIFKSRPEAVKDMLKGVRFTDRHRNLELMGSAATIGPIYELFDNASALWAEAGVIDPKKIVKANQCIHSLVQ